MSKLILAPEILKKRNDLLEKAIRAKHETLFAAGISFEEKHNGHYERYRNARVELMDAQDESARLSDEIKSFDKLHGIHELECCGILNIHNTHATTCHNYIKPLPVSLHNIHRSPNKHKRRR